MVARRVFFIAVSAFVSVSIAMAGGPDAKYFPKSKKAQRVVETIIEPVMESVEPEEMIREVSKAELIPAQPSDRQEVRQEPLRVAEAVPLREEVTVLFESKPANVELLINGLYVGSTPIQVPLYSGVHNVKMLVPGFRVWERQIKAYEGLRVYAILEEAKTKPSPAP